MLKASAAGQASSTCLPLAAWAEEPEGPGLSVGGRGISGAHPTTTKPGSSGLSISYVS